MTKTQTEKWKDMDLADGNLYYWRMPNGEVRIMNKLSVYSYRLCYDGGKIDILAPVPSYDEYNDLIQQNVNQESAIETYIERIKELEKKLEIATKALKKLTRNCNKWEFAREALKEMEGVK